VREKVPYFTIGFLFLGSRLLESSKKAAVVDENQRIQPEFSESGTLPKCFG